MFSIVLEKPSMVILNQLFSILFCVCLYFFSYVGMNNLLDNLRSLEIQASVLLYCPIMNLNCYALNWTLVADLMVTLYILVLSVSACSLPFPTLFPWSWILYLSRHWLKQCFLGNSLTSWYLAFQKNNHPGKSRPSCRKISK